MAILETVSKIEPSGPMKLSDSAEEAVRWMKMHPDYPSIIFEFSTMQLKITQETTAEQIIQHFQNLQKKYQEEQEKNLKQKFQKNTVRISELVDTLDETLESDPEALIRWIAEYSDLAVYGGINKKDRRYNEVLQKLTDRGFSGECSEVMYDPHNNNLRSGSV